ncbi:MAG TPA: polysaccharide biosynthesis/export family protein [Pyrinomonadaceae bacterium]|nr:polysaccharide biosynthesis/export family protein [Pyrinomonadaceae bacterium]
MFRSLAFSAALLLSGPFAHLISAQSATNHAFNRAVSSKDKAEAKRLYKEGVKYGEAGLFAQAAQILQRATKLDPGHADAHFALGHAYYDLKQWRNAIESFKVAVALNPKDDEARDRLGLARAMLWEEDSARIAAERRTAPPQPVAQQVAMNTKTAAPPEKVAEKETKKPIENAAAPAPVVSAPAAAPAEIPLTKIYRVGPADVLDIRVNDSNASQSTLFTITPAGFLEHPMLAEPLAASGLTVDEISARVEGELKRRALVQDPKVLIGVRDYASHTILVSGLVKESGPKILRREAIPLYVVVADAQPLPEAEHVTVVRNETNETFEADLAQANEMNLLVRPGDVVTLLAPVTQFVYLGGEVKLPGEKRYRRGLTLTQVINAAGGVTSNGKEARIGRDDGKGFLVVTRFKLKEIESGKIQDPVVKPGDRITVRD